MDHDKRQEDGVDVRFDLVGFGGSRGPVGGVDAFSDRLGEAGDGGAGVGLEELVVDLAEDVADRFRFVGEFDGEGRLEEGDELRDELDLEGFEVRERDEHAHVAAG